MIITSKYAGACRQCGGRIEPGERVDWIKGRRGVDCSDCSPTLAAERATADASRAQASDLDVPAPAGLAYLPYQRAGIAALLAHAEGSLLADEMGLGKTVQVAGLLNAAAFPRVLVVCPKSLAINWTRELVKWLVDGRAVGRTERIGSSDGVTVVTYEEAKKHAAALGAGQWDLLVVDEAHAVKNPKTQRSKALAAIRAVSHRVVLLTGTPIVNRPVELFPLLKLCAPAAWDPKGKGFFAFARRYCDAHRKQVSRTRTVWDFSGSSNLDELGERLRGTCLVRRLKADVLTELPAKRRQLIELEPNGARALLERERRAGGDLLDVSGDDYEAAVAALRAKPEAFAELSRIRAELAIKIAPKVAEHVAGLLDGGTAKIVVGAHHHAVIDALAAELSEYGVVTLTGQHGEGERMAAVDRFQTDAAVRVFVGQIQAAGVGLTLTASSTVVMAELPWTPGECTQFEDRCHRIGQLESVNVQHVVVGGSVSAHVAKVILDKQAIADAALDTAPAPRPARKPRPKAQPKPRTERQRALDAVAETLTADDVERVHECLRRLAGRCDGGQSLDGSGFARADVELGHDLAARDKLSPRQAALGLKFVRKYQRQLGELAAPLLERGAS